jgi:hypothetical protein
MASDVPKKVRFTKIQSGQTKQLGDPIELDLRGEYKNSAANQKVRILIRMFYQVAGVPFVQQIYSDDTDPDGSTNPNQFFVNKATLTKYSPKFPAAYTFQIIAWDGKTKPASGSEQITHKARILVR